MIDRPRFIYAYAEMAPVAEDSRKNPAEGAPRLVIDDKLSAEDATTRLRIAGRSIAVACCNCFRRGLAVGSVLAAV